MKMAAGVNLKVEWGVAVQEPRTAFELASEDLGRLSETGIHELRGGGKGSQLRPHWEVVGTGI